MLKHTGRRGATLLLLAFLDIVIGFGVYTAEADGRTSAYSGQLAIAPLWMWACAWWYTAVILVFSAFRKHDAVGFAFASGIKFVWALSFLLGYLIHNQERAWISAGTWIVIALWLQLVSGWPEERQYE